MSGNSQWDNFGPSCELKGFYKPFFAPTGIAFRGRCQIQTTHGARAGVEFVAGREYSGSIFPFARTR
jgi:hypothetical protein